MLAQENTQTVQGNTQKVKDLYAAFGRGDMPSVLEAIADDAEWVLPGPADFPMAGTYRGKQAVQGWFGTLVENIEFHAVEPREFIAQGDKVVVLFYREGTMRRSGRTFAAHDAHVFTLRDGKITRHEAIEDTAAEVVAYRGA